MILPLTKTAALSPILGAGMAALADRAGMKFDVLQSLKQNNPATYQALMTAAVIAVLNAMSGPSPQDQQQAPQQPPPHQWPLM